MYFKYLNFVCQFTFFIAIEFIVLLVCLLPFSGINLYEIDISHRKIKDFKSSLSKKHIKTCSYKMKHVYQNKSYKNIMYHWSTLISTMSHILIYLLKSFYLNTSQKHYIYLNMSVCNFRLQHISDRLEEVECLD